MNENNPVKSVYVVDINALPQKDMTAEEVLEFAKSTGYAIYSPLTSLQSMVDELPSNERGKLSDGYHTFDELYSHRIALFIALCNYRILHTVALDLWPTDAEVWRSRKHSDGSEWEGWFILGINKEPGKQVTYHLPISYWEDCYFAETLLQAPEWDGHTSADVLERLKQL